MHLGRGRHDTIDLSIQARNQVIDLRAGHFQLYRDKEHRLLDVAAVGNVAIAFNVDIEDAEGGFGNDKITGTALPTA